MRYPSTIAHGREEFSKGVDLPRLGLAVARAGTAFMFGRGRRFLTGGTGRGTKEGWPLVDGAQGGVQC